MVKVIEYSSSARGGYSVCQVVRYAALDEQDDPADPRVYICARVGEKPFRAREGQLRDPRYTARFTPEAWLNDQAVKADPEGPQQGTRSAAAFPARPRLPGQPRVPQPAAEKPGPDEGEDGQ